VIGLKKALLLSAILCVACKSNYYEYKQVLEEYSNIIAYAKHHNGNPANYPFDVSIKELKPDKTEYLLHFTKEDTLVRIKHLIQNDSIDQEINYYYDDRKLKVCAFQDKRRDTSFHHFYITGKFEKTQLKLCPDLSSHQEYYSKGMELLTKLSRGKPRGIR